MPDLADRVAIGDDVRFVRSAADLAGADVAVVDLTVPGVLQALPDDIGRVVGFGPHVSLPEQEGVQSVARSRFFHDPRRFIFQ